jgi:Fe-S cluster assembly ATP-binding protein
LDKLDFVHVFAKGKILKSGDSSLAGKLEEKGYDWVVEKNTD